MYCSRCGSPIDATLATCPSCGLPVHGAEGAGTSHVIGMNLSITFIEDGEVVAETTLDTSRNTSVRFGSDPANDLVVAPPSRTVSGHHGIISMRDGWCYVRDDHSSNGLYLNGTRQTDFRVTIGDVVSIGRPRRGARRCVMVVGNAAMARDVFPLQGKVSVTIGRMDDNDLALRDATVSAHHAQLMRDNDGWSLVDLGSTNGTKVDGVFVRDSQPVYSGSALSFGNAQTIFLDSCLLVSAERHGVDVIAHNLVRYRKNGRETRVTTDHVSLHIKRGDFVAIVGGSGCGKSTLLNELNGAEPADEGTVELDGTDLYSNYELLKNSIGYVPQADIVYDNLRLRDMLAYAAKLRMQPDTTAQERAARVEEVIGLLELDGVRDNLIGRLSGGQKKRASIAVELLADPRLLFLDEPTSGLDPGIERKLMESLAKMAHEGRTIILVTHTTLNLHLCDQVVFLGAGGKLCYAGAPSAALPFFGVSDFVDVYPVIERDPSLWEKRFADTLGFSHEVTSSASPDAAASMASRTTGFWRQFLTLSARYARLLLNDWSRLLLMVVQAPLLAALINLVAGSGVFEVCEDTKFCLFALSCAAFWVGIFDSIQEICKEGNIFSRESDGGLRSGAYLASKVLVLGALCLVQTVLLVAVLILTMGTPQNPIFDGTIELLVSTYLTVLSAMSLGLFVSALFRSPDKALAMAPILIMPQILFSGIAFELNDVTEKVSYAINCRWAIEALGTTADLNGLDLLIYGEEITVPPRERELHDQTIEIPETTVEVDTQLGPVETTIPAEDRTFETLRVEVPEITETIDDTMLEHEQDDMFEHTPNHLLRSWGILLGFSAVCILGCWTVLKVSTRK